MRKQQLTHFLDMLIKTYRTFHTRKEILHEYNRFYNTDYSYEAFKKMWQTNNDIAQRLNKLVQEEERQFMPSNLASAVHITGNTVRGQEQHSDDIVEEILRTFDEQQTLAARRSNQTITFEEQYVVLVNMSDIHISDGVDIQRVKRDMEIIAETPGMYLNFLGDLTDNFIGEWAHVIARSAKITPRQQLVVAKSLLESVKDKLVAFTTGNHDEWSNKAAGFDILYQLLLDMQASAIYDTDENIFTIEHFGRKYVIKVRHEWPGRSATNITYGIERDYLNNDFDIGIGGHTHQGGIYREFVGRNQETKAAIMCGCYKPYDNYGRQLGLKKSNKSTAVCILFDADSPNGFSGITDIETAAKYLKLLNKYGK